MNRDQQTADDLADQDLGDPDLGDMDGMADMGAVFDALGSATRRRILDIVKRDPGCTVGQVAACFDTTRVAVMRQLRLLEDAGLLISQRDGRKRCLFHNAVPIQMIYDRWTTEYSALWAGRMADLKYKIEAGRTVGGVEGERDERDADESNGTDG